MSEQSSRDGRAPAEFRGHPSIDKAPLFCGEIISKLIDLTVGEIETPLVEVDDSFRWNDRFSLRCL